MRFANEPDRRKVRSAVTMPGSRWRVSVYYTFLLMTIAFLSAIAGGLPAAAAENGQQIAAQGNGRGATACSVCHGPAGMGNAITGFPRLAGLNAEYLASQLRAYRSGSRNNAVMQLIANALDESEVQAVSNYYATQEVEPAPLIRRADREPESLGERLATRGAWNRNIPECVSCHGPGGAGVGAAFPRLAGQHASYIVQQLVAWKQGSRTNDPAQLMRTVAEKLTDEESAAVAEYFANLGTHDTEGQEK